MTISSVAGKSADAFRTISEVAEALKLPQHVLRFWETRFAQIKPMKRAGGRRFYRPEDVELLGAIRQLLYGEGYTIKGVQRILREQGPRAVAALARGQGGAEPGDLPPYVEAAGNAATGEAEAMDAHEVSEGDEAPTGSLNADEPEPSPLPSPFPWAADPADDAASASSLPVPVRELAMARLSVVLAELDTCRRLLDDAGR